jgi:hypothetical protein
MTTAYSHTVEAGNLVILPGGNYTEITSANAILIGNQVRLMLTATRVGAVEGNIANEKVATIQIAHGSKIKGMYNTASGNGGEGGVASFYTTNSSNPVPSLTQFDLMLAATTPSSSKFHIIMTIPVVINPNYYV